MNYVSESVDNFVNCSHYFSTNSSGFICQPVRFNKSVHKHVSSSIFNKPTPSVDANETFCAITKCKKKKLRCMDTVFNFIFTGSFKLLFKLIPMFLD